MDITETSHIINQLQQFVKDHEDVEVISKEQLKLLILRIQASKIKAKLVLNFDGNGNIQPQVGLETNNESLVKLLTNYKRELLPEARVRKNSS